MTEINKLLAEKAGIFLDVACGSHKQSDLWVGMDIQALPGVDIVHDLNVHPWPLPDECAKLVLASHIVEHIPPCVIDGGKTRFPFIEFMDDAWRILKPGGEIAIAAPHGSSQGFLQDPTHCNPLNENTWIYFDPLHESGFYRFYQPRPWKIKHISWNPAGNVEAVLIKRIDDRSYHE